jgi:hypothetical protein
MVVGFTPNYAISCEVEYLSWRGVLDTILGDKVCRRLAASWWFSPNAPPIKKKLTLITRTVTLQTSCVGVFLYSVRESECSFS